MTTMAMESEAEVDPLLNTTKPGEVEGNEANNDEITSDVEANAETASDDVEVNDENQNPQNDVTAAGNTSKVGVVSAEEVSCSPSKKRKAESNDEQEEKDTDNNEEDTESTKEKDNDSPEPVAAETPNAADADLLNQPIKKARSGYFIFMEERRPEIQAKHKGEGVAVVAREMGKIWKSLSDDEKAVYLEKAALEKEEVAKQREQMEAAGITLPTKGAATANSDALTEFPLAKVRRTCKLALDADVVKGLSKEALLLVTKCAELATEKLGMESVRVAQIQNRRTIMPEDVTQVCQTREQFMFLRDDVNDLAKQLAAQKQNEKGGTASGPKSQKLAKAISNSKPLTSYFSAKSS